MKFNWKQQQSQGDCGAWPAGLVEHGKVKEQLPGVSFQLNQSYKPFCTKVGIVSRGGTCREVQILRDSRSLQSIVCSSMVEWFEYVDTKEVRRIQGLFGAPVRIPLVRWKLILLDEEINCCVVWWNVCCLESLF